MTDYTKYINALRKCAKEHKNDRTFMGYVVVSDLCRDTADLLETLAQEPKIGHWINRHIIANTSIDMIVCSECGEEFSYDAETGISEYNYCPNCGARMSESKFFAKVAESYCKGLQDGLTAESEDK